MARKLLTEEIYQMMYEDYTRGATVKQLCEKYDFKPSTIKRHFYQRGVCFTGMRKFEKAELNKIIEDYKNGMRPFELAKKYNRCSGTIIGKLQDIGVYERSLHHFTSEEVEMLKVYYPIGDWETIFRYMPDVSKRSIHIKMNRLGITADSYFWSDEDVNVLKQNYERMYGRVKELIDLFNGRHTYSAICAKAQKLRLKTRSLWDANEIKIMQDNYSRKTLDEMLVLLPKRNRNSIISQAIKLGLKNCCKYQDCEVEFIIKNWKTMSDEEMAIALSKTLRGLKAKRESLGLHRVKERSCYSDIYDFLRKNNSFWKESSMRECKYKCVLTGKRFDDIHHVRSFNLIVSEVIEVLNVDIKKSMDEFEKDELRDILDMFRAIQDTYPPGVCLQKEIHALFHNIYGYGGTTEDDWNEFVLNYRNNKYNHLLDVA